MWQESDAYTMDMLFFSFRTVRLDSVPVSLHTTLTVRWPPDFPFRSTGLQLMQINKTRIKFFPLSIQIFRALRVFHTQATTEDICHISIYKKKKEL